jgi:hypothetical protein
MPMAVEVEADAVTPVGAEGTVVQVGVTGVVSATCAEAADVPSPSTAFMT